MRQRESFPPQPLPAVVPKLFGFEIDVPAHSYGPAVRPYWLLHYVTAGFGTFVTEGETYTVTPGSLFVIPPEIETFYCGDAVNTWDYIWIGFDADTVPDALRQPVVSCPAAGQIFEDMKRCGELSDGKIAFLTAKLYELFALLTEQGTPQPPQYVAQAISCMESEYMLDLSVGSLADRLGLDRSYFSTLFQRETGVAPGKYLTRLRLEKAAQLLTAAQPVATVARSCGYMDPAVFTRAFRRHFGVSPREYRTKNTMDDHE
ncbi:MAG: AraC family transcriptional regulator [Oscillospiraceae bacterium]|nr:AraC family transcriptional regulator [Oscillospiraceae bacterium]